MSASAESGSVNTEFSTELITIIIIIIIALLLLQIHSLYYCNASLIYRPLWMPVGCSVVAVFVCCCGWMCVCVCVCVCARARACVCVCLNAGMESVMTILWYTHIYFDWYCIIYTMWWFIIVCFVCFLLLLCAFYARVDTVISRKGLIKYSVFCKSCFRGLDRGSFWSHSVSWQTDMQAGRQCRFPLER